MSETFFERPRARLDAAVAASAGRTYFSALDESPSPRVYGEHAAGEGRAAYEARLGAEFSLETAGGSGAVGGGGVWGGGRRPSPPARAGGGGGEGGAGGLPLRFRPGRLVPARLRR